MKTPQYDLSLLKPNGSHYIVIGLLTPYCIDIPDGNYEVLVDNSGRQLVVQIIIKKIEQSYETVAESAVIYKKANFHSSAFVYIPARAPSSIHEDREKVWQAIESDYERYRSIALKAVNRMIKIYRHLTGEFMVKPIVGHHNFSFTLLYNRNPPDNDVSDFTGISKPIVTTDTILPTEVVMPDEEISELRSKLLADWEVSLTDELLLNAYDFLDQRNYKLAVIEAEIGFEIAITQFLLNEYTSDSAKVKKLESINSFTTLVKHPMAQQAFSRQSKTFVDGDPYYDNWLSKVWKIRGDLVHGRQSDIPYKEALLAVKTVDDTLNYLFGRPKTKWRQYARYKLE